VWPEDVPEDVLTGSGDQPATTTIPSVDAQAAAADAAPRAKRNTHLKLVE
jgi:hypothetical protein